MEEEIEFTSIHEIFSTYDCLYVRGTNYIVGPVMEVDYDGENKRTLVKVDLCSCPDLPMDVLKMAVRVKAKVPKDFTINPPTMSTNMVGYAYAIFDLKNLSKKPFGTEMGKILYGG